MSDETPKRSVHDIEADLQRTRDELTNSVNELANRLDPKANVKAVTDSAKSKVSEFASKAKALPGDASEGDSSSIAILAGSAATAGLALYLLIRRK